MKNDNSNQVPEGFMTIDEEWLFKKQSNPGTYWLKVVRCDCNKKEEEALVKEFFIHAGFDEKYITPDMMFSGTEGYWECASFEDAKELKNHLEKCYDVDVILYNHDEYGEILLGPDYFESEDEE